MTLTYRVFISSTQTDLEAERKAIQEFCIRSNGEFAPVSMENFNASPRSSLDVIRRQMKTCDLYILIIAGRYGSLTKEGISYTEQEYDWAVELGLPIFAFLHEDVTAIPSGRVDQDRKSKRMLENFKNKVQKHQSCYWSDIDSLIMGVNSSLYDFSKEKLRELGGDLAEEKLASVGIQNMNRNLLGAVSKSYGGDTTNVIAMRANRYDLLVIDDGMLIYDHGPSNLPDRVPVALKRSAPFNMVVDPDRRKLNELAFEEYHEDIASFFFGRISEGGVGRFQTKVGLSKIGGAVKRVEKDFELGVVPLSYWEMEKFNRILSGASSANNTVQELKDASLLRFLQNNEARAMDFPSALYVEVTITTKDGKLLIPEKNPTLSVMAQSGRRFTASLEEGLSWHYYETATEIDLRAAVARGLKMELEIDESAIVDLSCFGVGLEAPTLNSAILGEVKVDLTSNEIEKFVSESPDYGKSMHFVDWDDVPEKVFTDPIAPSGGWHSMARMRAYLSLRSRFGEEETNKLICR